MTDHVARNGEWCPGWGDRAAHVALRSDLTADHVTPVAAGGREDGPLTVRCRACNSAKGARVAP
ncbi:HNH endonuclease [Parafrankia sp. BMG5.11]|uniref:HNH endonuclease n=1 Tax=Parafrankia sp. BMG5.11 TaxID=222540 RepID=UPI001A9F0DF8|nr:HNH endonuclease [Parafrankia sp. BMG5.11]